MVEGIGRGGMASVFKARDPKLERYVAIKVIPSYHTQDPTFIERFRQEAQAVARLNHPNIIQVHDFGEDKGFSYIVMELMTGRTLLEDPGEKVPFDELLELVGPIASALDYAHRQGIAHRDIKPSNVLLDEEGNPKLADFGLARLMQQSAGLTRGPSVLGTPEYMAPEQALGKPADEKSDIYALGIMVYQMLLGRTPFQKETPLETLMAHIHEEVPAPTSLDADLDPRIESVLLRVLAKEPGDRFPTAVAFAEALAPPAPKPDVVMRRKRSRLVLRSRLLYSVPSRSTGPRNRAPIPRSRLRCPRSHWTRPASWPFATPGRTRTSTGHATPRVSWSGRY